MTVGNIHANWAWVVVFANAIVGSWALLAHWRPAWRSARLWWFTIAAQSTILVQVVLGAWLVGVDEIEAPGLHNFYGFVALFTVGMIYAYRTQVTEWQYLLYGLGGLFLMGLAIRAMILSSSPFPG